MRHLYLPWGTLTLEEQETAIREVRLRGVITVRCELRRYNRDGGEPVSIGQPVLYANQLPSEMPAPWDRYWRWQSIAELCEDLRVCLYGDAWERARRELVGEPALPRDVPTLRLRRSEAWEQWDVAQRELEDQRMRCARSERLLQSRPDLLPVGEARVREIRARDEYWLAVMLVRVAEWEAVRVRSREGREVCR